MHLCKHVTGQGGAAVKLDHAVSVGLWRMHVHGVVKLVCARVSASMRMRCG